MKSFRPQEVEHEYREPAHEDVKPCRKAFEFECEARKNDAGDRIQKNCEIDFIATNGSKRYYIQSALSMDDPQKEKTEVRPLSAVKDSFKKIIVSKSYGKSWTDEEGILRINIIDFLLDENSLER